MTALRPIKIDFSVFAGKWSLYQAMHGRICDAFDIQHAYETLKYYSSEDLNRALTEYVNSKQSAPSVDDIVLILEDNRINPSRIPPIPVKDKKIPCLLLKNNSKIVREGANLKNLEGYISDLIKDTSKSNNRTETQNYSHSEKDEFELPKIPLTRKQKQARMKGILDKIERLFKQYRKIEGRATNE